MDGIQLQETKMRGFGGDGKREEVTGLALSADGMKIYCLGGFGLKCCSLEEELACGAHVAECCSCSYPFRSYTAGYLRIAFRILIAWFSEYSLMAFRYLYDQFHPFVEFLSDTDASLVFEGKGAEIASLHSFYVRGTDCLLGNWSQIGQCSKTCGGGQQRFERPVLIPAEEGGRPCPALREREEDCFDQPCPEEKTDCLMGQWTNEGACSTSCGYGMLKQRRVILRASAYGGRECPDELERNMDCVITECGGYDFLVSSMPGKGLSLGNACLGVGGSYDGLGSFQHSGWNCGYEVVCGLAVYCH
eukprot:symbB.v1.2.011267.t1/scaffold753.1/size277516/3